MSRTLSIAGGIYLLEETSEKLLTQTLLPPPLPALPSNSRKEAEGGEGGPANSQPLAAMELGLRLTLQREVETVLTVPGAQANCP